MPQGLNLLQRSWADDQSIRLYQGHKVSSNKLIQQVSERHRLIEWVCRLGSYDISCRSAIVEVSLTVTITSRPVRTNWLRSLQVIKCVATGNDQLKTCEVNWGLEAWVFADSLIKAFQHQKNFKIQFYPFQTSKWWHWYLSTIVCARIFKFKFVDSFSLS